MKDDRHTPAFPNEGQGEWADPEKMTHWQDYTGLTRVEHAALVTGQPCSGTPWLDEMLAKARRERLAGQALAGIDFSQMLAAAFGENMTPNEAGRHVALGCMKMADALIAALEGGAK